MHYSKIHVSYGDGSKARSVKVVLGFKGLLGGMTTAVYTDSQGTALVRHESTGEADIYVSGNNVGSFHAPGETAVFLS